MEPKLFTPQFNEHAEEFKKYLPVNINLRFETVASPLALCEETYLRPLLGKELFDRMITYVEGNPTLAGEDPDGTLIDKARFALQTELPPACDGFCGDAESLRSLREREKFFVVAFQPKCFR